MQPYSIFDHVGPFFHKQARLLLKKQNPGPFAHPVTKEYPRMPRIVLPEPLDLSKNINLTQILSNRISLRDFTHTESLNLTELSTLLLFGFGNKTNLNKNLDPKIHIRFHPSGGARLPLEYYVIIPKNTSELSSGLYHYHINSHSLEHIYNIDGEKLKKIVNTMFTFPWVREAPCYFIVTAEWQRTLVKYNDFGYPIILLEAGHACQNVLLVGEALGIGTCSLAGFKYDEICEFLDIDGINEAPIHTIALGKRIGT